MITFTAANKYAVVRSFGYSSFVGCSRKSSVITKIFESYSEVVSSSLKMKALSGNELEEPTNVLFGSRCDN